MRGPRRSIISLIVVSPILAADLAWLRWSLIDGRRSLFGLHPMALDLGIIPMASALTIGGYRLAFRRRGSSPFLVGFMTFGSVALIAYSAWCLIAPEAIDGVLRSIEPVLDGWSGAGLFRRILVPLQNTIFHDMHPGPFDLWQIAWVTALLSFPQAMAALVGGIFMSRMHRMSVQSTKPGL